MRIPLPRAVLATVLLTLSLSLLAAPPASAQTAARYESQARSVTNDKRASHDMRRFDKGACVQRFAERQARRMANQTRMFHQDLGRVMRRCNLSMAGENVAYGYRTGRLAVRAWMKSPGHRANILNRGYRLLGMATRRGPNGQKYSAQVFGRH